MGWKRLAEMDVAGKRCIVRVDINVPIQDGVVSDATRIEKIAPTIRQIFKQGGRPVLLAHFGRPKGQPVADMSLRITLDALSTAVGAPVAFHEDCRGADAVAATKAMPQGTALLMENTRFHPGEEANDPAFAAELAELGDIFCNDAFSACHRAHASTVGLAKLLPSCAGLLLQSELEALETALEHPEKPVVAVVGGAKVSSKLALLGNLIEKVDTIVIGGGMANTFLAAQGHSVGKSLCEHELVDVARDIMKAAEAASCELLLPTDVVVAREFKAGAANDVAMATDCPDDAMILDAGPASIKAIVDRFESARTLVWNGPLGAFEIPPFDAATNAAAAAAATLTQAGSLLSVAGGGDTVSALNGANASERFTYVSTAGGAFLEWLEGKTLPGIAALSDAG